MPTSLIVGCLVLYIIAVGSTLAAVGPDGAIQKDAPLLVSQFFGVLRVTVVYTIGYYSFIGAQVQTKGKGEQEGNISTRGVMNTLESAPFFLAGLWMHAAFVNPRSAEVCGWFYVGPRLLYVHAYGFYGKLTVLVEFVTLLNHNALAWLYMSLICKGFFGFDLLLSVCNVSPFLVPVVGILVIVLWFGLILGLGAPAASIIVKGVEWENSFTVATQ